MKRLTLLRHAKSSWADADLPDLERPLSRRGEKDAPMMGKRLKAYRARPSLIVTSHAVRAKATAKIVAGALGYPEEFLLVERGLYAATPERILAIVEAQDDRFGDMLVVGHNPGLTDLVKRLLPDFGADNVPTCGVVAINFETDRWAELHRARRRLAFYDFPKNTDPVAVEDAKPRS